MTTATIQGTDLSWVVFTNEEPGEACEYLTGGCPAQATHIATFKPLWRCIHECKRYCLAHRDVLLQMAAESDNYFRCPQCGAESRTLLVRIDPL